MFVRSQDTEETRRAVVLIFPRQDSPLGLLVQERLQDLLRRLRSICWIIRINAQELAVRDDVYLEVRLISVNLGANRLDKPRIAYRKTQYDRPSFVV